MMSDNPSAVFFFNDWRDDLNLRRCTFEEQGLWMFMLCFAHNPAPDFGYVVMPDGERKMDAVASAIAELRGCHVDRIGLPLAQLLRRGVFSLDECGHIFCRRMVRDGKIAAVRSKAGIKGASARWGTDKKGKRKRRSHRQNDDNAIAQAMPNAMPNTMTNGMAENASSFFTLHTPKVSEPLTPSHAKTVGLDTRAKDQAPPSPERPAQSSVPLHVAARADAEVFAQAMGLTLTADASRNHWPDTLARAVEVEGLDFRAHLVPAAREAAAKGKPHLAYALAIARSYRAEGRAGPVAMNGTQSSVALPEDGDDGWRYRLRLCFEQAQARGCDQRECWGLTWGPFPFTADGRVEPTTLVPVHIAQAIIDARRKREAASTAHG